IRRRGILPPRLRPRPIAWRPFPFPSTSQGPMIATLSLMSCVLAAAQPADHSEWLLLPQLGRAQEFVYRGSYEEKAAGSDLEFERKYALRGVAFVLEAAPRGADVALLTVLRPRNARGGRLDDAPPSSARL